MSRTRRVGEAMGRLHAILGVPGLIIGSFSLVSLGFGLVVLARESDRLRDTGRKALRPVLSAWVRTTPVHYLGWTLPDYVDRHRRDPSSGAGAMQGALDRLGEELDRPSRRTPLVTIVSMRIVDDEGRSRGSWYSRTAASTSSDEVDLPLFSGANASRWGLATAYRLAPEVASAMAALEASYRRLALAVTGLSGYSLLCLGYMILQARSLRDRAAREAAQAATLDLADRTCHELGNVAFVLANERGNLAHHLDLVDRFVEEEADALRAAAARSGLDPAATDRLLAAVRREYGRRGIDPDVELRSDAAVARDVCRQIAVGVDYMGLTVRELDAYLRKTELPVSLGPLDLGACLDDALALLGPAFESAGARLDRRPGPSVIGRADRRLLVHALVNLIKNGLEAADAAGRTPEIAASCRATEGRAVIEVGDNGAGIAPGALPRLFEDGQSTKGPGRGRGLAIVREAVAAQEGEIAVDSQPGRGTTFRIFLPVLADRD